MIISRFSDGSIMRNESKMTLKLGAVEDGEITMLSIRKEVK